MLPLPFPSHWIFDMDGTLTRPVHDFDAIRKRLGLAEGKPILETLAELPPSEAAELHGQLEAIEQDLAERGQAWPEVADVLGKLAARGAQLGILTRNTHSLARITLDAAGLSSFFEPTTILGRKDAEPKPSPAGVQRLLAQWDCKAEDTVVVGDYLFDLQAGRAAGCRTVLVDREGHGQWRDWADEVVPSFHPFVEAL
ncbi:MAG: HAD family hydrolase [Myxococcota bacterium]|nr:HAD family hydrolase [Myxococcota bacterium]